MKLLRTAFGKGFQVKEIVILAKHPENHCGLKVLLRNLFPECRIRIVAEGGLHREDLDVNDTTVMESSCI